MTAAGPVLRTENATRQYAGSPGAPAFTLAATTLDILPGTWTVITGRSGAGKTTLLHLLAGLDRPDTGSVWLFDVEVSKYSDAALSEIRRNRLGIVYQRYHFIEHLPVWQNVSCRLVPAGVPGRIRRDRAERVLGELGLRECGDRLPRNLSGGEQQRVALARAVIGTPDVLIADEPTSDVDPGTGELIVEYLRRLRMRGTTIVVATHDPASVAGADRHYMMEGGRIVQR